MTRILEWLFFANQRIASSLSAARAFHLIKKPNIDIENATVMSHASLAVVNQHLKTRHWLVGESATIADIACYPYIALAHQGNIELDHIQMFKLG
jgi:glutathione S-transferase